MDTKNGQIIDDDQDAELEENEDAPPSEDISDKSMSRFKAWFTA